MNSSNYDIEFCFNCGYHFFSENEKNYIYDNVICIYCIFEKFLNDNDDENSN